MERMKRANVVAAAAATLLGASAAAWTAGRWRSRRKQAVQAPPGIRNVGNTCFANAVLQAMASCRSLVEFLEDAFTGPQALPPEKAPLASELRRCLLALNETQGRSKVVDVKDLLHVVEKHMIASFDLEDQQDASEFYEMLCDALSMELEQARRSVERTQGETTSGMTASEQNEFKERNKSGIEGNGDEDLAQKANHKTKVEDEEDTPRAESPIQETKRNRIKGPYEGSTASTSICLRCATRSTVNLQRLIVLPLAIPHRKLCGLCLAEPGLTLESLMHQFIALEMINGVSCSVCSHNASLTLWKMPGEDSPDANGQIVEAAEKVKRCSRQEPECSCPQLAEAAGLRWQKAYATGGRRMLLAQSPQLLCIQLRRASYAAGGINKILGHVSFPQRLDLTPFQMDRAKAEIQSTNMEGGWSEEEHDSRQIHSKEHEPEDNLFELQSVVVHHGEGRRGHYTVYRRMILPTFPHIQSKAVQEPSCEDSQDQQRSMDAKWFSISDTDVHPVPQSTVFSCEATALLYERQDSDGQYCQDHSYP